MCGIFGVFSQSPFDYKLHENTIAKLMELSCARGKEASGLLTYNEHNKLIIAKSEIAGTDLLKTKKYQGFVNKSKTAKVYATLGHSRLATHGSQINNENNQPVLSDSHRSVVVHNGIVTNPRILWNSIHQHQELPELDTIVLAEYIDILSKEHGVVQAIQMLDMDMEGSASIAYIDFPSQSLLLYSNTGSLYYILGKNRENIIFASEKIFLQELIDESLLPKSKITKIEPKELVVYNSGNIKTYRTNKIEASIHLPNINLAKVHLLEIPNGNKQLVNSVRYINRIDNLVKHTIDFERIRNQKRCSKCLLPASTPFIGFDEKGVCNFCKDHSPIRYKGKGTLEEILKKYRSKDGSPDCIAAFSGGRDSSYGLHYLKKELGMNPLAYTYDWGMVTDLARRNQARILGSLGVEHLLLSADINKKREHIRKNILAWMKDPHLGMVPLFMQGDKQCEFYADQLMKKYNIKLMFFFRGNEFEKEEFKNGHCGIKDADPGGVIHHLPFKDKIKLLSFYGWRYLKNPAYFNASFWDTSLAYFSTYIQQHDYLYLWHYIPWNEEHINKILLQEYNWEQSSETTQMWRTDDGSSAFYNYIYCQVQGFTENDSFRSRQIREGVLNRKEAFEIVMEENRPRYESLKWYFDLLNMDGSAVLDVVDKMPKLY